MGMLVYLISNIYCFFVCRLVCLFFYFAFKGDSNLNNKYVLLKRAL